ncbi:MAG: penicillin-binding protein [Candidatus Paralactobacillus gallistercoris]|uniref:Penicillin-binding protein n=1 Tax=Candidatus Paralactobacillus gallistercoris TaxID=2838724 RepID=A0A948X178_9LACO|nr:penicillin-binding protein [Candidatus Paralactobacillus gallistercoris]
MKVNFKKRLTDSKKTKSRHNRRVFGAAFLAIIALVFLLFVCRFSYIAINGHVKNVNLKAIAADKYLKTSVIPAQRGNIYDATGNVIAEDAHSYTVYAVLNKTFVDAKGKPLYVTDKDKVADVLSKNLKISRSKVLKYLNPKENAYQVEFGSAGRNLSLAQKDNIEKAKLKGIYFNQTPSRLYPNGVFASHEVGLAQPANNNENDPNNKLVGIMGIEKYFNKQLTGKNGHVESKRDNFGYNLNGSVVKTKAQNGDNVYLTLDSQLETYLETLTSKVQKIADPKELNAVVMDAKTGQILAVTQRPSFNPMTRKGLDKMWRDALVADTYEPGSVMKILTLSAAINTGHYNPNELYDSGSIRVGDSVIKDWQTSGWGVIPLKQAFPRSSNVGMIRIEQDMGAQTWFHYMRKFGLGKKTGIQLPGEEAGSIQFKRPVDQAVTSFGQGVNVTMVQMLQAVSAVANNGTMMQPQIVSKIVNPNTGKTTFYKPKVVGHPITPDTAKQVRSAMQEVVNDSYGTGRAYKIPGQQVAVKTGTAQIANPNGGGYLTGDKNYLFSVMGIAPANNPRYMVYITMKQPQNFYDNDTSATKTLALIFNPLMQHLLTATNNSNKQVSEVTMPSVVNKSTSDAEKLLTKKGLTVSTIGTGNTIVQQLPLAGESLLKQQRVLLLTNGAMTMPDTKGWSKDDVMKLSEITGAPIKINGDGYVVSQSLKPGALMKSADQITITLKQPD